MADADAHAPVVVLDMRRDRAQAVVAGVATTRLDPELGRGEVDLVVEHVDVALADLDVALRLAHRLAAVVHIGLRLQERHAVPADRAVADKPVEAPLPRPEAVPLGDAVERHEADVVAMARVARARIAETDKELHGPCPLAARAGRARPRGYFLPFSAGALAAAAGLAASLPAGAFAAAALASAGAAAAAAPSAASPSAGAAPSAATAASAPGAASSSTLWPATVATVKSRPWITVFTPSGSVIAEMCSERPISSPSRLNSKYSGMASARQVTSISCLTMFKTPPRLSPGDRASCTNRTGTLTRMRAPGLTRWKSTCTSLSLTGSSCTSRGMTRVLAPPMSRSSRVDRNRPRFIALTSSLENRATLSGARPSP